MATAEEEPEARKASALEDAIADLLDASTPTARFVHNSSSLEGQSKQEFYHVSRSVFAVFVPQMGKKVDFDTKQLGQIPGQTQRQRCRASAR